MQKIESGEVAASLAELVAIQATLAAEGIEFERIARESELSGASLPNG